MENEEKILADLQQVRDELEKLKSAARAREEKSRQGWIRSIVVWLVAGLLTWLMFNAFRPQVPRHADVPKTNPGNSN
jgi:hypothetical protein